MKNFGVGLVLCYAAALIGAPGTASAFEFEGSGDPVAAKSLLAQPHSLMLDPKAHSLAMPLSENSDSNGFVSTYGNAIPIPGPGIDLPAPAWAYSPGGAQGHPFLH